jgi:hypothetical protein
MPQITTWAEVKVVTYPSNADAGCLLVAEYVDQSEILPEPVCPGDIVQPQLVLEYIDVWAQDIGTLGRGHE